MSMSSQEFRELQHEFANMWSIHVEFTGFFLKAHSGLRHFLVTENPLK